MTNDIKSLINTLIPRGGEKPTFIHVSLEEYLSRLANLNRKMLGVSYRIETWKKLCKENQIKFEKINYIKSFNKHSTEDLEVLTHSYSWRDSRLENEFETLLYSITSTLSTLTRVVACFLKGSSQIHSHSGLAKVLAKYPNFKKSHELTVDAWNRWASELTERRDGATHYIALSATSSIQHTKASSDKVEKRISLIQIPKYPMKYNSLWDDDLPTVGGSEYLRTVYADGTEVIELKDSNGVTVVKREEPLDRKPEFIEAEEYVRNLYLYFTEYITNILKSLTQNPHAQT